jgi:hypothetical protein
MAGIRAIEGVDNTLANIATAAMLPLNPRPAITVGPLDRVDDTLRLNWFLYSVGPNPAYRNMEPPQTGTRTARGAPPLALELDYVLTAHPGTLTAAGEEAQFAHRGLVAVMQALHDLAIIVEGSPVLAPEAGPLVEPLRITHAPLDLDGLSKLWTSVSQPLRTTVGYRVSLAIVDSTKGFVPGPPVRERRFAVVPSMGVRFGAISPARARASVPLDVELTGPAGHLTFTLRREPSDPAGPEEWPLTATRAGANRFSVQIAPATLAPGTRQLTVTGLVEGLPAVSDRTALTLVPAVTGPAGPVAAGANLSLATEHAAPDVEVFVDGVAVPADDVNFVSATQVDIVVPATTSIGPRSLMLRAAHTAGPVFDGVVVT